MTMGSQRPLHKLLTAAVAVIAVFTLPAANGAGRRRSQVWASFACFFLENVQPRARYGV